MKIKLHNQNYTILKCICNNSGHNRPLMTKAFQLTDSLCPLIRRQWGNDLPVSSGVICSQFSSDPNSWWCSVDTDPIHWQKFLFHQELNQSSIPLCEIWSFMCEFKIMWMEYLLSGVSTISYCDTVNYEISLTDLEDFYVNIINRELYLKT